MILHIKGVVLISLLMGIATTSYSQTYEWAARLGNSNNDEGTSVALDSAGHVYSTGYLTSTYAATVITKSEINGNWIWIKFVSGPGSAESAGIVVDSKGSAYILGDFALGIDFDPDTGTYNLAAGYDRDIFLLKLNAAGDFVWAKQFGGTSNEESISIAVDKADNIYITGIFGDTVDFDPGPGLHNLSAQTGRIFVAKYDSGGNYIMAVNYGSGGMGGCSSIAVDQDQNIFTTGWFSSDIDIDPDSGTYVLPNAGDYDFYIQKLDQCGNFSWGKSIGNYYNDESKSITTDASGNVYLTGYFGGTVDFDPGPGIYNLSPVITPSSSIFILKLDTAGNFVWAKNIGGSGKGLSISLDNTGNVYTTGYFSGTIDFDPGIGTCYLACAGGFTDDIYIWKLNPFGDFIFARNLGGTNQDHGNAIAVDIAEDIYITGYFRYTADFNPPASNTLTSAGGWDMFLAKYGSTIVGNDVKVSGNLISIYPNPTNGNISIDLTAQLPDVNLIITNLLGEQINKLQFSDKALVNLSIEGKSGIYFLRIDSGRNTDTFKIIKQ